jgi:hypothetical protein
MRIVGGEVRDEVRFGQRPAVLATARGTHNATSHASRSPPAAGAGPLAEADAVRAAWFGALRRRSEPVAAPLAPQLHHAWQRLPRFGIDRPRGHDVVRLSPGSRRKLSRPP